MTPTSSADRIDSRPFITICTPTYNRADYLGRLYESLCAQDLLDFEWLIVDDGSSDGTSSLISSWIAEDRIPIRYFYQQNGGKHRVINRGVREASGILFFIVDSDDYLTPDAIQWIKTTASPILHNNKFAGISGIKIDLGGNKVGGGNNFGTLDCNALDIRIKHGVKGDLAEVYKTAVLKEFPFPEIDNERFCPEALVWNRIARQYKIRYCHKGIYVCEYLPDGLTAKIIRLRHDSPRASMIYYSELFHDKVPLRWKLKAAVNFWRFKNQESCVGYKMLSPLALLGYLPATLMKFSDNIK